MKVIRRLKSNRSIKNKEFVKRKEDKRIAYSRRSDKSAIS